MSNDFARIQQILGEEAEYLLTHQSTKIPKQDLHLPVPNAVERNLGNSSRSEAVKKNLQRIYNTGRLANTGYLSILPVDQGIEHGAGYSFVDNPMYFDPENIVKLALEGGCNAVASTFGVLSLTAKKYSDKIPFIVKVTHNDLLSYPNRHKQYMFGDVMDAHRMGAAAVGATIYFGGEDQREWTEKVAQMFSYAHELGMATILWCYTRNHQFQHHGVDYHNSADISGQAVHLGVTLQADIVKQKLPDRNWGMKVLHEEKGPYGKVDERIYTELATDHPIDLTRYQLANSYMGMIPLISSGGESGTNDEQSAVRAAVINKRAGGSGLIMGRKAFKKTFEQGVSILNLVQDVYLCPNVEPA